MHHPTRDGAFARTVINGMHSRIPFRAPVGRDDDAEDQPATMRRAARHAAAGVALPDTAAELQPADIPWASMAVVLVGLGISMLGFWVSRPATPRP
jgi:hypothetical protein